MGAFKEPQGGSLKKLCLGEASADEEKAKARYYKSWDLTELLGLGAAATLRHRAHLKRRLLAAARVPDFSLV